METDRTSEVNVTSSSSGEPVVFQAFYLQDLKKLLDAPLEDLPRYLGQLSAAKEDGSNQYELGALKMVAEWRLSRGT